MSAMEVDNPPQLNGFSAKPDSEIATSTNGHPQHVKFSGVTEVKTYTVVEMESPTQVQRQKHKARRRARVPKLELEEEGAAGQSAQKPLSPSKLKKMADKDRHSRTGRRGLPKKGLLFCCFGLWRCMGFTVWEASKWIVMREFAVCGNCVVCTSLECNGP